MESRVGHSIPASFFDHHISSFYFQNSPSPSPHPFAVVDNVTVPRQPTPKLKGIYFITPSDESIRALIQDFSRRGSPQYGIVHVFFSSPVDPRHLEAIRGCSKLVERLATLKEVNLEYILYPDYRSFTTAQDNALPTFFGANIESSEEYKDEIKAMATRLATIFSTLKENPSIRYRAALPPGEEYPPGLESRLLVSQRLAVELYEVLSDMQRAGHIPERETCEIIITDRGFDPVAPIIHEWTYEAMIHDLLEGTDALHGKVFTYDAETQGGKTESKDHILDERDSMHVDLRHRHFASASLKISQSLDDLRAKSRVASRPAVGALDLRSMGKLVQALPQYRDQLQQLAAHVELASSLNRQIDIHKLTDLGKLEQDLVYGDATSKELIAFLSSNQMLPATDKVRALLCYSATHQEKLDPSRQAQWQKVARLTPADMRIVSNLEYLGIPVYKRQRGGGIAGITFGRRRRRAVRKDRDMDEDEQQFALSRFVPLLTEVLEDAASGRLSQDEYPYVRAPGSSVPAISAGMSGSDVNSSGGDGGEGSVPNSAENTPTAGIASYRTIQKTAATWAKKAAAGGSGRPSSPLGANTAFATGSVGMESGMRGGRLFAFVIGGFTYSELRTAHRLTGKIGRDVLLGGTSIVTPVAFMQQVSSLSSAQPGASGAASFEVESSGTTSGTSARRR